MVHPTKWNVHLATVERIKNLEICVLPQRRAELELYEPCQRCPCKLGQYKKVPFYDRSGRPTTTTRRKGCAAKFKICASLQLLTSDNHDERAARRASKIFRFATVLGVGRPRNDQKAVSPLGLRTHCGPLKSSHLQQPLYSEACRSSYP